MKKKELFRNEQTIPWIKIATKNGKKNYGPCFEMKMVFRFMLILIEGRVISYVLFALPFHVIDANSTKHFSVITLNRTL